MLRLRTAAADSQTEAAEPPSLATPLLSVIVPVAPGETHWTCLLDDLTPQLPAGTEVLFAATEPPPDDFARDAMSEFSPRWLITRPGRAAQMTDAARLARGTFLWFLHADTRLPDNAVAALTDRLRAAPDALHYFDLRFGDGPRLLRLNELGVRLRCRTFGLPFGDQGFCLCRETFLRLGGFDESAPYGEDHLLVWTAKRNGVPPRRVPATLTTSGRKYARHGWTRTTLRHVLLTLRQALPEALRPARNRRTP